MDEMDLEDSAREKEKQKRPEGGVSPDLKRERLAEMDAHEMDLEDSAREKEKQKRPEGGVSPDLKREMPQEYKDFILKVNQSLIAEFGTADSFDIDVILRQRARVEEEARNKEKKEETEEEMEKKTKIEQILSYVDSLTVDSRDLSFQSGTVGNLNFFLLSPWSDMDCTMYDMDARSLDMYYKRLMPNTESACRRFSPSKWNRLPEVDLQYVTLYNNLEPLFQQKSWASFLREMGPEHFVKARHAAKDAAKALNLLKLREADIHECIHDVFKERDTIAEYKLRTDYDLYLLECLLHKLPEDFKPDDPSEISHNLARFYPPIQQRNFSKWTDEVKFTEKSESLCAGPVTFDRRNVKD